MAKVYDNANDLITFARSSGGTSLRRVSYGDELVTNGDFDTDTDWVKATGWTIGSGVASANIASGFNDIDQAISVTAGKLYNIELSITSVTSGSISVYLGNSGNNDALISGLQNLNTPGDYQGYIVFNGSQTQQILIRAQNGFVGSIDNVSVKEVFLDRPGDPLTVFNHPEDMPRIDFDTNGVAKGLLIEKQRTNLLHSTDNPPSQATDVSAGSHTLSFTAGPSTSSIDQTLDVNAVDVFVYDTKNDTDGGAWRTGSRAQASSWYNETLNTDTRGARREFPEVAVIVAESDTVTIYDGDDPSLPMWMVFNRVIRNFLPNYINNGDATSVAALNGVIVVGDDKNGVLFFDILGDTGSFIAQYRVDWNRPISERNDNTTTETIDGSVSIVNSTVNDVAMTVLPDAPIDPDTGLPVPTIAVATDGGVSVIKDDGTVVDSLTTNTVYAVLFADQSLVWCPTSTPQNWWITDDVGSLQDGFSYSEFLRREDSTAGHYPRGPQATTQSTRHQYLGGNVFATSNIVGNAPTSHGVFLYQRGESVSASQNKGMVAKIQSGFNTGWMNGDIKGAFLADTDDTDLIGAAVFSATFDDAGSISSWTGNAGRTWDAVNSALTVTTGANNYYYHAKRTGMNAYLLPNTRYRISFDVIEAQDGSYGPALGLYANDSDSSSIAVSGSNLGVGSYSFNVTTPSSITSGLQLRAYPGNQNASFTIDNISVKLADADRSVNNNGLIVNGTVTRSAVATGAELVAYSGFSSSNYLEQPYNPDLDFGQGDFCIMGWVKLADTVATKSIICRRGVGSAGAIQVGSSTQKVRFDVGGSAGIIGVLDLEIGDWSFFCCRRASGVAEIYVNGVLDTSVARTNNIVGDATYDLTVGIGTNLPFTGSSALIRVSGTAPTAEQIAKIYNDEKLLFQPNAKATLDGTSDDVTALAHDPETNLLHVGTNQSRSVFYGLRRINQTGTAVTTAISAVDGLISEQ